MNKNRLQPHPTPGSFTDTYGPDPDGLIRINGFTLQRYQQARHFPLLNDWLCQPYARFWGMADLTVAERAQALADLPGKFGMVGYLEGQPKLYIELYDPKAEEVGQHFPAQRGDCGMHILLAPTEQPVHGFSRQAMVTTMAFILLELGFYRVVVEPDVGNSKIHRLNHAVGIQYVGEIQLRHKRACLGFATAKEFTNAIRSN